ncbi:MAG: hypothetical protein FJW39_19255 [Acidobacteria bacterium]|nr:hypothetical protein [Acidobacteriota bacterium]
MLSRRRFSALATAAGMIPAQAAELPRPAKPFSFELQGGKKAGLADTKGKVTVLAFVKFT